MQLVDSFALVVSVGISVLGTKMSPLEPVYRSQITFPSVAKSDLLQEFFASITIPDPYTLAREHFGVGTARNEPQKLGNDTAKEDAFRRQKRKGVVGEGKAERRRSKESNSSCTGTVWPNLSYVNDSPNEIEVLIFL